MESWRIVIFELASFISFNAYIILSGVCSYSLLDRILLHRYNMIWLCNHSGRIFRLPPLWVIINKHYKHSMLNFCVNVGVGLWGYVIRVLNPVRHHWNVFQSGYGILHSHQQWCEFKLFSLLLNTGSIFITNSISLLVISLFRLSISSWFFC